MCLYGCVAFVSDSYELQENYYEPIDGFDGTGKIESPSKIAENHLPRTIDKRDELVEQLGSPFVADTGNDNDGYPILDWEKQ